MKRDRKFPEAGSEDERHKRTQERPQRPEPDPDTMEGPGGRQESKSEEDSADKISRRGER